MDPEPPEICFGRWRSDAIDAYSQAPISELQGWSRHLAQDTFALHIPSIIVVLAGCDL